MGTITNSVVVLNPMMEVLRVQLEVCLSLCLSFIYHYIFIKKCKSRKRGKPRKDMVCCRDPVFYSKDKDKPQEQFPLFEEELDLNFDKVFIYTKKNSPAGRYDLNKYNQRIH